MTVGPLLEQLVQVPGRARAAALVDLLPWGRLVPFTANGQQGVNVVVGDPRPRVVLGAHHDVDPRSPQGAIDNTAAVATLASLAQEFGPTGMPPGLAIAFWDLEEPGNRGAADGAEHYARALHDAGCVPELVTVCDVFGIGIPWLSSRSDTRTADLIRGACALPDRPVPSMPTPGSDDVGFARAGVPSALMITLPPTGDRSLWRVLHTPEDNLSIVDPASLAYGREALATLSALADRPLTEWAELRAQGALRRPPPRSIGQPTSRSLRRDRAETSARTSPRSAAAAPDPQLSLFT